MLWKVENYSFAFLRCHPLLHLCHNMPFSSDLDVLILQLLSNDLLPIGKNIEVGFSQYLYMIHCVTGISFYKYDKIYLQLDLEDVAMGLDVEGFQQTSFFLFGIFAVKMDHNLQILFHGHPKLKRCFNLYNKDTNIIKIRFNQLFVRI